MTITLADVYLDNLLVGVDGTPVMLDFELAFYGDAAVDFVKPETMIRSGPSWPCAQMALPTGKAGSAPLGAKIIPLGRRPSMAGHDGLTCSSSSATQPAEMRL